MKYELCNFRGPANELNALIFTSNLVLHNLTTNGEILSNN